ncbi:MAG: hypothetical protein ACREAN_01085 [Nitrosopumilaceae archaeon]
MFKAVDGSLKIYKRAKGSSDSDDVEKLILVAREHYVVSRVSFLSGYSVSAYLLLQQSFEMYIRAILKANGHNTKAYTQHDLVQLLSKGRDIPEFVDIAKKKSYKDIFDQLYLAYDILRFGEDAGHGWSANALPFIDELALKFETMLQKKVYPSGKICLYVHDLTLPFFLNGNGYFNLSSTTNNRLANHSLKIDAPRIDYAKEREDYLRKKNQSTESIHKENGEKSV